MCTQHLSTNGSMQKKSLLPASRPGFSALTVQAEGAAHTICVIAPSDLNSQSAETPGRWSDAGKMERCPAAGTRTAGFHDFVLLAGSSGMQSGPSALGIEDETWIGLSAINDPKHIARAMKEWLHKKHMKDNARPHVAGVCQQFLKDESIDAMDWPARSPDLNLIEHILDIMSRTIHQRHVAPQTVQELADALVQKEEEEEEQEVEEDLSEKKENAKVHALVVALQFIMKQSYICALISMMVAGLEYYVSQLANLCIANLVLRPLDDS
ncbi:unnamed protein product [Ranitomeya imitator]|uniref:Piezo TM1-24 domain-containing protein n=1 Tax=Ranitomeya imitator TaxID=111125 RepID=A0ABN9MFQ1_9NEOB|nr:unnamed protein product [Ranitomeya imitator]